MSPTPFTRRILFCATGMSPQIVTETLFALAKPRAPDVEPWIPTEIHLVTTKAGAEHARLNLLSADPGWFPRLRQDYKLPEIRFTSDNIHVIADSDGCPLQDIRTPADNESAANQIAELLRAISADETAQIHVSLAGGRKTMGYYLGYALSLYGRPQDRLSHVLVNEPYEALPEFYYPTPYERVIHTRELNPRAVDCAKAVVDLAEIPFVRLRDGLPERLLEGRSRFTEAVELANLAHGSARISIWKRDRKLNVNGIDVSLNAPAFALYLWAAERVRTDRPHLDWNDRSEAKEFLHLVKSLYGETSAEYEKIDNALSWRIKDEKSDEPTKYFSPLLSRDITKPMCGALGKLLGEKCLIKQVGARGRTRYALSQDLDITIY